MGKLQDFYKKVDEVLLDNISGKITPAKLRATLKDLGSKLFVDTTGQQVEVMSLATLRANTAPDPPTAVALSDVIGGGTYYYVPGDLTSADNGVTMIVSAAGKRYRLGAMGEVFARKFCWGTGLLDDTANLQLAADIAAAAGAVLNLESYNYRISGPVTFKRGLAGIRMGANGSIKPVGSGYTAISSENAFCWNSFQMKIDGGGNAVNGLVLNNPQRSNLDWIRVENCNGKGVEINSIWDSTIKHVSVELCGNENNYAFALRKAADTCNHTTIERLQIEQSNQLSFFSDTENYKITIDNLHAEKTRANQQRLSYFFGGSQCNWGDMRLTAIDTGDSITSSNPAYSKPAFAGCEINGQFLTINGLKTEDDIPVKVTSWDANGGTVTINDPVIEGTFGKQGNGTCTLDRGRVSKISSGGDGLIIDRTRVGTLTVGFCTRAVQVNGAYIGLLASSSANSMGLFRDCDIEAGNLLQHTTILINTTFNCGNRTIDYKRVRMDNSVLVGNIATDNGFLLMKNSSRIEGDLTLGPNRQFMAADPSVRVTGVVNNFGAPESSSYADIWRVGDRNYHPKPVPGGIEYLWCSTGSSGGAGIWQTKLHAA